MNSKHVRNERDRERVRIAQRRRREGRVRIDYYPSVLANDLIDSRRARGIGGDASSIINQVLEAAIDGADRV